MCEKSEPAAVVVAVRAVDEIAAPRLRRGFRRLAIFAAILTALGSSPTVRGQAFEVLHSFTVPSGAPSSGLIHGSDGNLYGTTERGGGASAGTVFKVDISGNLTTIHTFSNNDGSYPVAPVVEGTDGSFYGTTIYGGSSGKGAVYKVDSSGNFVLLHSFNGTDGANPWGGLVQATDGNFYGTTEMGGDFDWGTFFKIDSAGTLTSIYSFGTGSLGNGDPIYPFASLIQAPDGMFYGTSLVGGANSLGTAFKIDASGNVTVLHSFNDGVAMDGAGPAGSLVRASDGKFYGTTQYGGANQDGTIFRVDSSGNFASLHSFNGTDGALPDGSLIQAADGKLYGTTGGGGADPANQNGTTFRIDTSGNNFASLHSFAGTDGSAPVANLIQISNGNFYATTQSGGANGDGTFFRMDSSGNITTLYTFGGPSDGYEPEAGVIQGTDGNLYGTTYRGGPGNSGTVFKLDLLGNATVLHSFSGPDGANPYASLLQASDGNFYGTTTNGGTGDYGALFQVGSTGGFATLHSFDGTDGLSTSASLIQASDGNLYGTMNQGGDHGDGTIFNTDTAGNVTTLHSFAGPEGLLPAANVIQATDGNFYGTTTSGGANTSGNVFKMNSSHTVTDLHSFAGPDGYDPRGGLIQGTDGKLYGTTHGGGANLFGSIFKVDLAGNITTLHSFAGTDGADPYGSLVQASDGKFYGTTYDGGANNRGTVYKIDSSGNFTTIHDFSGSDGAGLPAGLVQASDGWLYGTGNQGGAGAAGVVFRVASCAPPVVSSNGAICAGQTLQLFASSIAGATYSWTGPNGFASTLQNPTIPSATLAASGTYSVTATVAGCTSLPAKTAVTVTACQAQAAALVCDAAGNSVLEPGESVILSPSWKNLTASPLALTGSATSFTGPAGATYTITDGTAGYGTIASGATASCAATGNCYGISVSNPATRPLLHWDASFAESVSSGDSRTWLVHVGSSFTDVPTSNPFYRFVETLLHKGITGGCGTTTFCPGNAVTRGQMAVFLLVGEHGTGYMPPPCTTPVFNDVPCSSGLAPWVDQLVAEGITAGCGGGDYCPATPVTRAQMAVFLLIAEHGSGYVPPPATGIFNDVPVSSPFAKWIEELFHEGITAGCGGGNYCPNSSSTRGQMAVFLTTTFGLKLYGP